MSGLQNGASSPLRLWQSSKAPPAVEVGTTASDVDVVNSFSEVEEVPVAVNVAGRAFIVDVEPSITARTGVIIEACSLTSTVTHRFKSESIIEVAVSSIDKILFVFVASMEVRVGMTVEEWSLGLIVSDSGLRGVIMRCP